MHDRVQSFIKVKDNFVPLSEFSGPLPDNDYIEGAIEFSINGKSVFSQAHWDLVDQLWAYILEGLHRVRDAGFYEIYFPDQPLLLRLKKMNQHQLEIQVGDVVHVVPFQKCIALLSTGADAFFHSMISFAPEDSATWEECLIKARSLSQVVRDSPLE